MIYYYYNEKIFYLFKILFYEYFHNNFKFLLLFYDFIFKLMFYFLFYFQF